MPYADPPSPNPSPGSGFVPSPVSTVSFFLSLAIGHLSDVPQSSSFSRPVPLSSPFSAITFPGVEIQLAHPFVSPPAPHFLTSGKPSVVPKVVLRPMALKAPQYFHPSISRSQGCTVRAGSPGQIPFPTSPPPSIPSPPSHSFLCP